MMKVYNDNIKPEFTSFSEVAIGDTFCVCRNEIYSVYIKTAHSVEDIYRNSINLRNGKITGFAGTEPVRLVDCELYWKFRGVDKCEECEG